MNAESQLIIDSRREAIAQARDWLAELTSQAGFSPQTISDLKLVLAEALGNVIHYAYDGEPGHQIILSLSTDDEGLTLTIHDFGHPPDASRYQTPDLSELREGGYDAFLIHSLMDKVCYDASPEKGTTLTLIKWRTEAEQL